MPHGYSAKPDQAPPGTMQDQSQVGNFHTFPEKLETEVTQEKNTDVETEEPCCGGSWRPDAWHCTVCLLQQF